MNPIPEISELIDQFDYNGYETPAAKLKALWSDSTDQSTKNLLQVEMDALNFSFHKGELQAMFSNTDEHGNVHEYPSVKSFDQTSLDYLEVRLTETSNTRLTARYSQILFNAVEKGKGKFSKIAIDSNIELIRASVAGNDDHLYSDISNALHISFKSKYRVNDVKQLILHLITNDKTPYNAFIILVPRVLEFSNLLERNELELIFEKANQIWGTSKGLSLYYLESVCRNGLAISNRLNLDRRIWFSRMGSLWEAAINSRKDDTSGMMDIQFCESAIENFQQAGEKGKVTELLKTLADLRSKLNLTTFEVKFTPEETQLFRSANEAFVSSILELEPEKIFGFIAADQTLYPNMEKLKRAIKGRDKSFSDFAQVIKFDINKNSRHENPRMEDDVRVEDLIEEYQWYFKFISVPVLQGVFVEGSKKGKIGIKEMVMFLRKHSWISKNITYKNSGGDPIRHNWMAMIAPSLLEFFTQLNAIQYGGMKYQNYITCIDSLVLKFEGILRDFARILKADTLVRARGITREAYIEELLTNPIVKEKIGQDDFLLFTFLFTTSGLNLRNNVAHGFLKYHEYNLSTIVMIVAAIIRISRYQVNTDNIII